MTIGILATVYIDNDVTYNQALRALDTMRSKYKLVFYARVTKLDNNYREILQRFNVVDENSENILSKSWNNGIKKALKEGCTYVIIPNLDIELSDGAIDNLVDYAEKDKESVMWSGRCLNSIANYPSGDFVVNSFEVYDHYAFFMVNDRLFKEVGKFDEKFIPAYGEDVDMQYRIDLKGRKNMCVENARFIHYGQTTVKNSPYWRGHNWQDQAHKYFIEKWGAFPRSQIYKTPFNK